MTFLFITPVTGKYDIYDWKTNKSIDEYGYGGKRGTRPPTYDLPDCNFYHYSLQLSLYKYLLENYHDVKIGNLISSAFQAGSCNPL
ncbi:MAG: hypothetical protein IPN18_03865 [Ignavibacteriales bacterium]|nr:hypothetical protein [Ignavibacteriales bacterium]